MSVESVDGVGGTTEGEATTESETETEVVNVSGAEVPASV